MREFFGIVIIVLCSLPAAGNSRGPVIIGEHVETTLQTPHPYTASATEEARLVWADEIVFPGAIYIAPRFAEIDLAAGDYVVVRSADSTQYWEYRDHGRLDLGVNGEGFFATHIKGDTAIIELWAQGGTSAYGYRIDKYGRGYNEAEIEDFWAQGLGDKMNLVEPASMGRSICDGDDTGEAKCYQDSDPDAYETARAGVRLVQNGSAHCTGWLIGSEGHVMTNEHCITSQSQLNNIDFEFMAEGATCATNCASSLACPGTIEASGGTFVTDDADLDYALVIPATATDLPATYGFMRLRAEGAQLDERLYIVQHPAGWGKRLAMMSSYPSPPDDQDGYAHVVSLSEPPCAGSGYSDVGYWADTQGGSSGSAVVGYSDNKVIALHHCAGSARCANGTPASEDPNRGVPIQLVIDSLEGQGLMPAGALCDPFDGPIDLNAQVTGDNEIIVKWDVAEVPGATFNVYRAVGGCPAEGETLIASELTGLQYLDTDVSGGVTYSYYVTMVEPTEGCESTQSPCSEVQATGACTLAPNFAGVVGVTNQGNEDCSLVVTWDEGASLCEGALVYNLYRATMSGFTPDASNLVAEGVSGVVYHDVADLTYGERYHYVVRAVDSSNGKEEPNTVEASARPTGPVTSMTAIDDLESYMSMADAEGAGWAHGADLGSDDWDLVNGVDHTVGDGNAFTSEDVGSLADKFLVSQEFVVSDTSVVFFWHKYDFEDGYDGGVIEISIDDGLNWIDLGPSILVGGYNDTISTTYSSPIAGREAWSGEQATFTTARVDLSAYEGESALVRWRLACDTSVAAGDWLIDDIELRRVGVGGPCETVSSADLIFYDGFETGDANGWVVVN